MLEGKKQLQARLHAAGNTQKLLKAVQIEAVRNAKLKVPRKTSNLGRTIRPGLVTAHSAVIIAGGERNVGYAAYVELGTRPHVIVPRTAKALAWGGERALSGRLRKGARPTHFARRVKHPGTKPRPFLVPALKLAAERRLGIAIVVQWNGAA